MNFSQFLNEVLAQATTDEAKAFFLGVGLAAGVRVTRAAIRFFKKVDE